MSSYTITTTVKIEVSGTTAHVSEPMVRAGEKVTPAGGEVSGVGLELLVKLPAVGGAQVTSQSSLTAATEVDGSVRQNMPVHGVEAHADKVESPVAATSPDAESITTAGSVDAVAIESAGVAADGVEGTDDSVTTDGVAADVVVPLQASRVKQPAGARARRGRSAAGAKATRTVRKASPKRATSVDAGRAYRRAPEDLESIFQQAGSASAVADYYDVPRHTAQGWIRTLRRRQAKATK